MTDSKALVAVLRAAVKLRQETPLAYYGPGALMDAAHAFDAAFVALLSENEALRKQLSEEVEREAADLRHLMAQIHAPKRRK